MTGIHVDDWRGARMGTLIVQKERVYEGNKQSEGDTGQGLVENGEKEGNEFRHSCRGNITNCCGDHY